jgi:hypothetical protein
VDWVGSMLVTDAEGHGIERGIERWPRFLPIPFVEAEIDSIRDPARQLAYGVPPKFLDGHAYHWIECERDGVQIGIAIRVHGREAYARGALALARMLSGQRLEPRKYAVQEALR